MVIFYWLLIAQIVLESFPISSSSHVALLQFFLERSYGMGLVVNPDLFNLVHVPTLFVLALFFYKRWSFLLLHIRICWRIIGTIIGLTFLADCVTLLFFIALHEHQFPAWCFVLGQIVTAGMLFSLRYCPAGNASWNSKRALMVGVAQGCALLPGISRFASTYVIARWLRLSWKKSLEVSFVIQVPLLVAAVLHSTYKLGMSTVYTLITPELGLLVCGATVIAWLGLYGMAYLMKINRIWWVSLYMIVPITLWIYMLITC